MTMRDKAELQTLLEGVPLPADKRELVEYARSQGDERLAGMLERLPDREYGTLDDVGEELLPVQPTWEQPDAHEPRDESGRPPGGEAYTDASAPPGSVREQGPGP